MPKINEEKHILILMVKIYCRKNHKTKDLCDECSELLNYGLNRLDHCKYGEKKDFCNKCSTQCYNKDKREQIRKVMRFSGPRMIFYNPKMAVKHLLS